MKVKPMNEHLSALKDIQKNTLRVQLVVLIALAWAGILFIHRVEVLRFAMFVIFLCLGVYNLQNRYAHLPNYVLICSLWLLNVLAFQLYGSPLTLYGFALLILFAVNLLNVYSSVFFAVMSSAFILLVNNHQVSAHLMMLWGNLVVCLVFSRGLHQALQQMVNYQSYALKQMDEARERRAELARLAKALSDAREHLHYANLQLRYARDAAEESRRLKVQFAANVSHELRTPINLILGFSEVMAMAPEVYKVPLPAAYRSDILTIYRNAKHLQNLINDILDISQIEAERLAIVKEETDPTQIIYEAANLMRDTIENKKLRLVIDCPDQLPVMWLDRLRIRQVILNLLANAVRFTDSGTITLCAALEKDDLIISVRDTGIGIPEDQVQRVFDEFYQVEGSLSRKQGGTGLGLTLSRQFVQQHGGNFRVESVPEKGSVFSFNLPLTNVVSAQLSPSHPGWQHDARGLVLYSENESVVQLFKGYTRGYQVVSASSETDCIRLVEQLSPLAVVLPQNERAAWLSDRIHGLSSDIVTLICPISEKQHQIGDVLDLLLKPVSRELLLRRLEAIEAEKVLIVDDEADLIRMFSRMLQSSPRQYKIRSAYDGVEGLDMMREERPDVVILDILMPEMDGLTVVQHMRDDEQLKDIPVILVSAHIEPERTIPDAKNEIQIIKGKRFAPVELVNCIEAVVGILS